MMWIEFFWQDIRSNYPWCWFWRRLGQLWASLALPITRVLGKMVPGPLPRLFLQGHCLEQWSLFWGQDFSFCRRKLRKGERGALFSGTYWVWMGWRFLTLPCALLTTALCVSVQKTNWTEPLSIMIFDRDRKSNLWSKWLRLSCWIPMGASRTAAIIYLSIYLSIYLYIYIYYHILYHIYLRFISYITSSWLPR